MNEKTLTKILSAIMIFMPFLFLFSIQKIINFGIWQEIELSGIILNISLLITTVTMLALIIKKSPVMLKSLGNPIPFYLIILALFSIVVGCASSHMKTNFLGLSEIQQGAWSFIQISIFIYAYLSVSLKTKKIATLTSIVALTLMIILNVFLPNYALQDNYNLVFFSLFVLTSILSNFKELSLKIRLLKIYGFTLFLLSFVIIKNNIVINYMLLTLLIIYGQKLKNYFFLSEQPFKIGRFFSSVGLFIMIPIILFGIFIGGQGYQNYYVNHTPNVENSNLVASNNKLDLKELQFSPLSEIWKRSDLLLILEANIEDHPEKLITGNGWGSFRDLNIEYDDLIPGRHFFFSQPPTSSRTYNDLYQKSDFSTFSLFADALNSVGIIGFILFSIIICSPVYFSTIKNRYPAILLSSGLVFLGSFGYLLNIDVGVLALAFASVIISFPLKHTYQINLMKFLFFTVSIMSMFLIIMSIITGVQEDKIMTSFTNVKTSHVSVQKNSFLDQNNMFSSQDEKVNLILHKFSYVNNYDRFQKNSLLTNYKDYYNTLYGYLNVDKTNVYSSYINLLLKPYLSTINKDNKEYANLWLTNIKDFLKLAPQRTDLVMPYVDYLESNKDFVNLKLLKDYVDKNLKPSDPMVSWVDGSYEAQVDHSQEGYKKLLTALNEGVGNYYPISLKELNGFRVFNMLPPLQKNDKK